MAEPSWTQHIAVGATWRRFGWMLLFVPVLACTGILVAFTALFQFFSMLAGGEPNPQLTGFGRELSRLASAIMDYLTYNTERRPFPFGHWPAAEAGTGADPLDDAAARSTRKPRQPGKNPRGKRSRRRTGASSRRPDSGAVPDASDSAMGIGGGEVPPGDDDHS